MATAKISSNQKVKKRYSDCDGSRMLLHWRVLCEEIGERRAGTEGETAAANHILESFTQLGLTQVAAEPFPCTSIREAEVQLKIGQLNHLTSIEARSLTGAAPTTGKISGELVWIEMPEQAQRCFQKSLKGKIAVLFGPMPTDVQLHRKLVAMGPAALIHVDDRLPFDWLKDDGVYPLWARKYGMPPTITIPFRTAWALKKQGANHAELQVTIQQQQGISQNVVGEIRGRKPELPLLVVSAHHDTQCNNAGADDNASGVVAVLELAAMFSTIQPLRTIRFISFGTEEQLSVGSAHYVQKHRNELSKIGAVLNMDSIASVLGHNVVLYAGHPEFGACVGNGLRASGLDVRQSSEVCPFVDSFPFTVFGIPAMTLIRPNMNSLMRWQHHSAFDNLDEISLPETMTAVRGMAGLIYFLAAREKWPFQRGFSLAHRKQTHDFARGLYGMRP
jgi:aminopeptidase YwaD